MCSVVMLYHGRQTQLSADRARCRSSSPAEALDGPSRSAMDGGPTADCLTTAQSRQRGGVGADDGRIFRTTSSEDDMADPVSNLVELTVEETLTRPAHKLSDESQDRVTVSGSGGNEVGTGKS